MSLLNNTEKIGLKFQGKFQVEQVNKLEKGI